MKKNLKTNIYTFFALLFGLVLFISSCNGSDIIPENNEEVTAPEYGEINSFTLNDLKQMKSELERNGVEIEIDLDEESDETRGLFLSDPFVKAIKVSTKTSHPDRSGKQIDVSGVLLVPNYLLAKYRTYRIAVVPPSTYTYNNYAPSNLFKKMSLIGEDWYLNALYYWALQAKAGYIVFIPDYPGFGDSYGQCFHPYMDAQALVHSTLDLLKTAQEVLTDKGYRYKKDLVISGYSLGAFVAASLAREIETNPSHGYSVNLLMTGGTPCNIKYIADEIVASTYTRATYFLPYALWGYKENAYPQINMSDFLLEPYASTSKKYYNGTYNELNELFPHNPAELYTEKFRKEMDTNPDFAYLNQVIDENSVKAWKNKCKFVMTHGLDDKSVYYRNAKNFSDEQKKAGGKVSFYSTLGNHASAIVPFYSKASTYLLLYKY